MSFSYIDIEKVRRVTRDRVRAQGDSHRTIQTASDRNKVFGIIKNSVDFFQRCYPKNYPNDGFDFVIDLNPTGDT